MVRPREITKGREGQANVSFRLPIQDFREFQDLCIEGGVDMSDKLRKLVKEQIEKKNTVVASAIAIGVSYGDAGAEGGGRQRQTNLYEFSDSTDLEQLKEEATYNTQFKKLSSMKCNERLEIIATLGLIQKRAAEDIIHYNKRGTYRDRGGGQVAVKGY